MLIVNAKIYTMEQELGVIESGYLRTEGTRIAEIGPMSGLTADPAEEVIDAAGASLFPGFIDAHCHIGMWEDSIGFEGDDGNEETDPSTPHLRAVDAINPLDRCFREAAAAGITTVMTGPGSANPIGGQLLAMKTVGRRIDDMILLAPAAIKFALGENPKTVYHGKNQAPITRMATAAIIREQLVKAERYLQDCRHADTDEDTDLPDPDAKCEALLPLLRGEVPAHFH
ncbi:MAG: amidohydrolase, partial [Ruminococcaceae bacterium]|nr:amidohydrolase [Oscillospiraceae bacterium]